MFCYHCGYELDEKKSEALITKRLNRLDARENKILAKLDALYIKYKINDDNYADFEKNEGKDFEAPIAAKVKRMFEDYKYKLREVRLAKERISSSKINDETRIEYICPRCGHLTHAGHDEEDTKSLSRACHAELQRGRNHTAKGMCFISLALILITTATLFFILSNKLKESGGGREISFSSPEFWVFVILASISVILLVFGSLQVIKGLEKRHVYTNLLKDINNETFVQ